ncbi:MAG: hypothetical protein RO257_06320 [Candidatus Kapabacteria bacterium]|jgi:hypothetical protein|nr:hypothetical protein [Candidatus Kapabacteria bacterium]
MRKSIKKLFQASLLAVVFFVATQSYAQLPVNTLGISASFASPSNMAGIIYTISNNMEFGVGILFNNESYSVETGTAAESRTTIGIGLHGSYYLSHGDVSPYLQLGLNYTGYPKEGSGPSEKTSNAIDINFAFGGHAFVVKSFAVWGQIGLGYSMYSETQNSNTQGRNNLYLFTSAVGASFYFN